MDRILIDSFEINSKSALRNLKFAISLCAMLLALWPSAEAQQPGKVARLGWLVSPGVTPGFYEAFRFRVYAGKIGGQLRRDNIY